ncbi:carboxylesterase/lipase family protein [Microbacterium sp. cf332]|uniref:carboxylesterase/lipase family protein n=1 Tax=Microbacterium sp. cf332 TaxID=1761804 RepID=UPI00088E8874|nr:carboxylesterase family protein [Microbacterium sp. cf332]SDQ30755.1 para-nitrobenzyl esterase [Microbacterium sp. cf332]
MTATVSLSTGRVRGLERPDGTLAFLGIPYALAPVGERRFGEPEPAEPWADVRDATAYGPTPQRGDYGETLIPEPSIPGDDTLSVNVFAPGDAHDEPLPVLVYIHGGGFVQGSAASPWYDGAAFARAGIVVVTVSYRLGFDGFGLIAGAPANRGVRDWIAALEWVQREVTAFGGDPGDVTIAGQSAGGGAVLTLLGMPSAQPLFRRALAISAALTEVAPTRAAERTTRLAAALGVAPTREGFSRVDELTVLRAQQALEAERHGGVIATVRSRLAEGLPWGPVVDGDLIPRPALDALAAGVGADKPLVLGTTDDEFTMATDALSGAVRLVPAPLALAVLGVGHARRWRYVRDNHEQRRLGTAAFLGRYATDRVFRDTVPRVARARGGSVTWTYRFSWPSPTRRWALHCLDVPFWWNRLDAPGVTRLAGERPPRELADAMHGAAVSFVRTGDPGWPRWTPEEGATRVFGGAASVPTVIADGYASVRALVP